MDNNKIVENISKVKEVINNINNLFSSVDKEIVKLNEKVKDIKKIDNKDNVITLYNSNKDNFKGFLNKLNAKVVNIEKELGNNKETDKSKEKKDNDKVQEKNNAVETKKEAK